MFKTYRLSSDCIPIRGYIQCAVYDLLKQDVLSVSESTYNTLINNDLISLETVSENELRMLIEREIVFECPANLVHLFPNTSMEYHSPFKLETCIIEIENNSRFNIKRTIDEISLIGCNHLQLWLYITVNKDTIIDILTHISKTNIINTDLIIKNGIVDVHSIVENFPFVSNIFSFSAETIRIEDLKACKIIYTYEPFSGCQQCGVVAPNQFVCNREFFILSANHNSCLYCKLSIDREGYIRNCPACPQHFGRVGEVSLAKVMEQPEFQHLWGITKDKVDVCCDCEFRRICPDCRMYTRNPQRPSAHPSRCTYNPYIVRWKGQTDYVPVEQCGEFTALGFVPDAERIKQLLEKQNLYK